MKTFDRFTGLLRTGALLTMLELLLLHQTSSQPVSVFCDGCVATVLWALTYAVLCAPVVLGNQYSAEAKEKFSLRFSRYAQGIMRVAWALTLVSGTSLVLYASLEFA